MSNVAFPDLSAADLFVDRIYEGGSAGTVADDPIQRLLPVGNQGGFRYRGSIERGDLRLVVLYTSGGELEWPDRLDQYSGTFVYFGDNRSPGSDLHRTARSGNAILRQLFEWAHGDTAARSRVPPIFVFERAGRGRDVRFVGLAAPGAPTVARSADLLAVWRVAAGQRFQNYKATFTILDEATSRRSWLNEVVAGDPLHPSCPPSWRKWVEQGVYTPLITERIDIRSKTSQQPADERGRLIIGAIHSYFNTELRDPVGFEACAVEIWRLLAPATGAVDVTRPWRDGGRDAIGAYLLGPAADRVPVEFALEAKCYGPTNSVGVREMSRLISRLRFRQFGVFVTTSHFDQQAYKEVRADGHPVVLVAAADIVEILTSVGLSTATEVSSWLRARFPG